MENISQSKRTDIFVYIIQNGTLITIRNDSQSFFCLFKKVRLAAASLLVIARCRFLC